MQHPGTDLWESNRPFEIEASLICSRCSLGSWAFSWDVNPMEISYRDRNRWLSSRIWCAEYVVFVFLWLSARVNKSGFGPKHDQIRPVFKSGRQFTGDRLQFDWTESSFVKSKESTDWVHITFSDDVLFSPRIACGQNHRCRIDRSLSCRFVFVKQPIWRHNHQQWTSTSVEWTFRTSRDNSR